MAHLHGVYDSDTHFVIDPVTRGITNTTGKKTLIQRDHNSERFTFELPRYIDEHDMSLCDSVEIHYINIAGNEQSAGVDVADDVQISPYDQNIVLFSWLISCNATRYAGSLNFLVRFTCLTGTEIDYVWHTDIHKGITVAEGMNNSAAEIEEHSDILEAWKQEVLGDMTSLLTEANTAATTATEAATRAEGYAQEAYDAAPTATVTQTADGAVLVVTDKNGTTQASIKGEKGYSPVRGTDYWTDEDVAEIKSYVDESILGGAW